VVGDIDAASVSDTSRERSCPTSRPANPDTPTDHEQHPATSASADVVHMTTTTTNLFKLSKIKFQI
jgi:hypothetical protein